MLLAIYWHVHCPLITSRGVITPLPTTFKPNSRRATQERAMDSSTNLPRKYFVVVTHNPALQLELEALLSSKRYNSYGTSQAKMFFEGVAPPTSAPKLMEIISPQMA